MGFEANSGSTGNGEGNFNGIKVDYEALNKYMVETCRMQVKKPRVGFISGIIDLGIQEQDNAAMEWNGSPEQEKKELEKFPDSWFEDKKDGKRYKCWKKKPVQSIGITVDFPATVIDKAGFYEEGASNPAPLRMILNGTFSGKLSNLFNTYVRKNDNTGNKWSFMPSNTLYKLGVGAEVINEGEPFVQNDIIKLLGKPLLFNTRIFINPKGYYTENISYVGALMEGLSVPTYDTDLLYSVGFNSNNDDKSIKFLTRPMISRIKKSVEYEKSKIKEQIERVHSYQKTDKPNNKEGDERKEAEPTHQDIPGEDPPF